jgi:hypothetical protein
LNTDIDSDVASKKYDGLGIRMTYSSKWKIIDEDQNFLMFHLRESQDFPWVEIYITRSNNRTLEQIVKDVMGRPVYNVKSFFAGLPARNVIQLHGLAAEIYYVTIKGDNVYIFGYRSIIKDFFKYLKEVEQTINSFEIITPFKFIVTTTNPSITSCQEGFEYEEAYGGAYCIDKTPGKCPTEEDPTGENYYKVHCPGKTEITCEFYPPPLGGYCKELRSK